MKKIAFIHPFLFRTARGIERYVVNLCSALSRKGIDTSILTWRWPFPLSWDELDPLVHVHTFYTSRYFSSRFMVLFYLNHLMTHHYDHLFIHFADYGEAAVFRWLCRLRRMVPYSVVLHFPYSQVPHRYHTLANSGLFNKADSIIAVSQFVASEAASFLQRECHVITHGVDTKRFCPDLDIRNQIRNEMRIPQDSPVLITVASLEERKGIQWVLRSLPFILERFPDTLYLILGEGSYRSDLESLVINLRLIDNVRFLGEQTAVVPYLQISDLMLILARGEASSIASLEAMACGLPVISSKCPPFDELIDERWGIRVDEGNYLEVSIAVFSLLTNKKLRTSMGIFGRNQILENHTWEKISDLYLQIL